MSLYRPSYGVPVDSIDSLRLCVDSSISMISSYCSLYLKNKIVYTFVALDSLFMAAVTMLYSLRASSALRRELSRPVVEANVRSCADLLRGLSYGRAVGERCARIVERLCKAVLDLFEQPAQAGEQADAEFLSWFGLKCQTARRTTALPRNGQNQDAELSTPSDDTPWSDLIDWSFDISISSPYCHTVETATGT